MVSMALPLLTFPVNSLDLPCCDVQQLPCRPLLYSSKCSAVRVWYVVCGGLEKHSKHKINVSKHFNNVGEKYGFCWFHLNSLMCPDRPRMTDGQSSWPSDWEWDYGSALSPVLSCTLRNRSTCWAHSLAQQWLLDSCLKSLLNHFPLTVLQVLDRCVTPRELRITSGG